MDILESIIKHEVKFCVAKFVRSVKNIKINVKFETDSMYMATILEMRRRQSQEEFDGIVHGVRSVIEIICFHFVDDIKSIGVNCNNETNMLYRNIERKIRLLPRNLIPNSKNLLPYVNCHLKLLQENVKNELLYIENGALAALDCLCENIDQFIRIRGLRTDEDLGNLNRDIKRHVDCLHEDMERILEYMQEKIVNNLQYLNDEIGRRKFVKFVSDDEMDRLLQRLAREQRSPLKEISAPIISSRRRRWRSAPGASRQLKLQVVPLVESGTIIKRRSIDFCSWSSMLGLRQDNRKEVVPTSVESGIQQHGLHDSAHQTPLQTQHQAVASTSGVINQQDSSEATATLGCKVGRPWQELTNWEEESCTPETSQQNNSQEITSMESNTSEFPQRRTHLTEEELQMISNFASNIKAPEPQIQYRPEITEMTRLKLVSIPLRPSSQLLQAITEVESDSNGSSNESTQNDNQDSSDSAIE